VQVHFHQPKTISVAAFYMDETEITNNEYRQFVYWVRDSLAHTILGNAGSDYGEHFVSDKQGQPIQYGTTQTYYKINWKQKIDWEGRRLKEGETNPLEEMYLPEEERFFRRKEIDTRKLFYRYFWVDLPKAARPENRYIFNRDQQGRITGEEGTYPQNIVAEGNRRAFVKEEVVPVYPDTLVWISDFTYAYNEPMAKTYFWHPAYDNYPVVGVNWKQARAFSIWRTNYLNTYLSQTGSSYVNDFRLPTESEWEYAARGGLQLSPYPWGGPYTRNYNGCFLANFKPLRGNYVDDGGLHTVIVAHYSPNDYGLYDMAGNVAEWTNNAFDPSTYQYAHDLNMDYTYEAKDSDPPVLKRKVIRGGSWKDISFYMQVSTRDYEYQDTATSYIGFRNVQTYLGRHKDDGPMSSNVYR